MPLWWNWQTRRTQNPMVVIPYRFDPDQRHHVAAGRIWRAVALQQPPRLQRPPSRAVVPALGQETARTMRRFQARKRSKPHRGFDKKALSRPFPKNLFLRKTLLGALILFPQKILCLFLGTPFRRVSIRFELAQTDFFVNENPRIVRGFKRGFADEQN